MINVLYYFLTFVGGTFFGSFLNLISDRIVNDEPIFLSRSKCDFCKRVLLPLDLIPLFSFLSTKGHCRQCKHKLSFYYPLSELLTGAFFASIAYYIGLFTDFSTLKLISFFYLAFIASLYIIIFFTDLKFKLIPDQIVFLGITFILIFIAANFILGTVLSYNSLSHDDFGKYLLKAGYWQNQVIAYLKNIGVLLLSALALSAFFLFLVVVTRGKGMGFGDVKLALFIGLFNGFPNNILAIFLGFLSGAVVSLVLIGFKKKTMKDIIPFGPFLLFGSVVAFVWGESLLRLYFSLFR